MACTIQIRRGLEANLPTLFAGELGFTTDTYKTYIGDGTNNHTISGIMWTNKTSAFVTPSNTGIFADTSGGSFVVTLPSNPLIGDTIIIDDIMMYFDTNPLKIDRNGNKINNVADDVFLKEKSMRAECVFSGNIIGWRIVSYSGVIIAIGTPKALHVTTSDTTPDVTDITLIIIDYNSPLSISDFDNGVEGQEISILFKTDQTTILNNTNIDFISGNDYDGEIDDVLTLIHNGTKWIESSKSVPTY